MSREKALLDFVRRKPLEGVAACLGNVTSKAMRLSRIVCAHAQGAHGDQGRGALVATRRA